MGDARDFTFCQVGLKIEDDHLESPKTIPNIGNITLEEGHLDGASSNKIYDNSLEDDSLIDNVRLKENRANGSLKQSMVRGIRESANGTEELKFVAKKPVVRAKVPFEKGYSQMDWLKITRTHPDLAGLKGQSHTRLISMDEVRQHKTEGSIWTVLKGRVYNISPYMKFHPGGVDMLMKAAGKDCTSLFNKYHAWVNAEFLLEKCLVGILDDSR